MFPAYSETRRGDVVTDNYLFPFVHFRHGNGLNGWQVWPLAGQEHKTVTTRTNRFDQVETIPGHEKLFALWPLYFHELAGIGSTNPTTQYGLLPAFAVTRSPQRDATTIIWPFFSHVDDRENKYREWDLPWLFVVFARGEGKHTSRVWPFYSHAASSNMVSDFVAWPIYRYTRTVSEPLDRRHTRLFYYLYSDVEDLNTEDHSFRRRAALWPLYTAHWDAKGNRRLQVLSILEPFLPENEHVEREYSPLYAFWRSETNGPTGATSQSLLWNLYRRQTTPTAKRTSLLFGLWQSQSGSEGRQTRLFYIPLSKRPATKATAAK